MVKHPRHGCASFPGSNTFSLAPGVQDPALQLPLPAQFFFLKWSKYNLIECLAGHHHDRTCLNYWPNNANLESLEHRSVSSAVQEWDVILCGLITHPLHTKETWTVDFLHGENIFLRHYRMPVAPFHYLQCRKNREKILVSAYSSTCKNAQTHEKIAQKKMSPAYQVAASWAPCDSCQVMPSAPKEIAEKKSKQFDISTLVTRAREDHRTKKCESNRNKMEAKYGELHIPAGFVHLWMLGHLPKPLIELF